MKEEGIIQKLKGEGGFWIPNFVVDRYLSQLGTRGIAAYVMIARSSTRWMYPGLADISSAIKSSPARVEELLRKMLDLGLINNHDWEAIVGNPKDGE